MEFRGKVDRRFQRAWEGLQHKGIVLFVLIACGAWAQSVSFLPHKDFPIGTGCCLVAAGDFDGNGKVDLVVGYGGDGLGFVLNTKLALLRGDGKGGFQPPVILATFDHGIYRMLASDVNRDGKLDLLIADGSPHTYVLLGKGDGTFGTPALTEVIGDPLVVADFNGDGIPDVFGADDLKGCDGVQPGKGEGTFGSPMQCVRPGEGVAHNIVAADLTGDGKLDVAWTSNRSSSESVWVALGNGDGTLRPFYSLSAIPGGGFGGHPLAIADLNHDGKPDLVVSGRVQDVAISLGNGDGTFQSPAVLSLYEGPVGPIGGSIGLWTDGNDVFVLDFDGDGNPDIIVDNALRLGKGDGTFQAPLFFAVGVPSATLVFVGDLNGDGKTDLVFINAGGTVPNGTALSVLLNDSPGFPNSVLGVSAATGSSLLAPASIASVYGKNLAKTSASANATPLPTQLGGISLRIRDNLGVVRLAPLYYVSPGQINFLVPADTPTGLVTLTVDDGSTPLNESASATVVNDVFPGFFTLGEVPAASAVRVLSNGSFEPAPVFNCTATGQCALTPIDLSRGAVYLSLFGTGFRASTPKCQVAGVDAMVQFTGAQSTFAGLDQLNILLPSSLAHGKATVQCGFGGKGKVPNSYDLLQNGLWPANPVQVLIQ